MTFLRLTPAMATHRGMRRRQNEDAVGYEYPVDPQILRSHGAIFVVADGVGGLSGGDRASRMAVEQIIEYYYATDSIIPVEQRLVTAFQQVNSQIYRAMNRQAATTLTAIVVIDDYFAAASVGDSLIFRIRDDTIEQINEVDVLLTDGVDTGALTKAIGYHERLEIESIKGAVQQGDIFLLCSDGLTRYLDGDQLMRHAHLRDPRDGVRRMINEANASGGADNISAILIHVGDGLPVGDVQSHQQRISVRVAVDTDPMIKLDVPTKPNTQIPSSRPEPVLPDEVLAAAETASPVSNQPPSPPMTRPAPVQSQSHSSNTGLFIAGSVVIVLGIIILIAAFILMNNGAATPGTTDVSPTATTMPQSTDSTVSPVANDMLQIGDVIVLDTIVLTLARFDDEGVAAFPTSPDTPYLVDEIIEDSEGQLWYRLQEEETGQSGWIPMSDLPAYRLQSSASD